MASTHINIETQVRQREQILDLITKISPTDRPVLSALSRIDAASTKVEWTKQALEAANADNANNHGFTYTPAASDFTVRTQAYNYTQLMYKGVSVDDSHEAVDKVGLGKGGVKEMANQKSLKLDVLLNSVEAAIVSNNARVQPLPDTGTAGVLQGAQKWISTNSVNADVDPYAGRLESTLYHQLNHKCWKQGGMPDKTYCGAEAKEAIAGWVTQVTRPVSDQGTKLTQVVDAYRSVTGYQEIELERNLTNVLLMLEIKRWAIAWLMAPEWETLGKTGSFEAGFYQAEMSLVSYAEEANGKITGLVYTA